MITTIDRMITLGQQPTSKLNIITNNLLPQCNDEHHLLTINEYPTIKLKYWQCNTLQNLPTENENTISNNAANSAYDLISGVYLEYRQLI